MSPRLGLTRKQFVAHLAELVEFGLGCLHYVLRLDQRAVWLMLGSLPFGLRAHNRGEGLAVDRVLLELLGFLL